MAEAKIAERWRLVGLECDERCRTYLLSAEREGFELSMDETAHYRADRDVLPMDPGLSYGLVEYLRILSVLEEHGWSRRRCVPHGGHQMALHVAAGLRDW